MSEPSAVLAVTLYQSHKLVHAARMTLGEFKTHSGRDQLVGNPDDAGYLVIYSLGEEDEYHSWSPKAVFEAGNTEADEYRVELIARAAHSANRGYCQSLGDNSQPAWDDAPDWQKDSARAGVRFHLANDVTPEQSHESWLAVKEADGWKYGPVKDADKKEHPCFVPYADLPADQKAKDFIFKSVVDGFKS